MYKRAMVVGGGVAGIQAALDLGDMGIETFLVEKGPSIGGRMAQLDKTFPTNDCAMCILSPKLVEVGSHPYIHIISNAELINLAGRAPHFKAKILKTPRYVDEEKCTGCGVCVSKCPTRIPDPYNKGLNETKCIHIPFPQAVPAIPIIDKQSCRYFRTGKCRVCEKFCQLKAIDFEQKQEIIELDIGAVVLACGSREFDARLKNEYGYRLYPNVITSIELERILSASGPTGGRVLRPADGKEPKKIAFLQCVGSRDEQIGNEHCSAVCCMQAAKDAIIIREHSPQVEITVFYMDIRAYGKGFDRFIDRSQEVHHTRYINGRIAQVEVVDHKTENLMLTYITDQGNIKNEEFDLLVISVGLEPSPAAMKTAHMLNVAADLRGFIDVKPFSPVNSSIPGIFTCGSMSGPKDIPESVMEASGAASASAAVMGKLARKEIVFEYPPETDIRGQAPRIGVFVCRCGINIASVVDVPAVVEYVSHLPYVKYAGELLFACAQDSQKNIIQTIKEHNLNRIVVSACTPRTHEPLFQKTLQASGLNPYLFEFANIREQCSWVHQHEPEKATEKAKDLVRNAVGKVALTDALYKKSLAVTKEALIIGAGLAGMTAALDLAAQGYKVHLLEKQDQPGGHLRHVFTALNGESTAGLLEALTNQVAEHPLIELYTNAVVKEIGGFIGNFTTRIDVPSHDTIEIKHGVVIVAAGADEHIPDEYLYGQDPRVITQRQFEELLHNGRRAKIAALNTVVMVQCVGSRDDARPYCSRICCSHAVKNALTLKQINPRADVYVLFRDVRTYGLKERFYRKAREKGVKFIRYDKEEKPDVCADDGSFVVSVDDKVLQERISISPDLLVLSSGVVPNQQNKVLSQFLKVPLNEDGFFLEAHVKLRPVDFATDGVFVCGLSHYPKDMGETVAQARAAAGRAATVLSKNTVESEGKVSYIRPERCSGCSVCISVCPYSAIELDREKNIAVVNEALCKGCGVCAASCRASAIDVRGFKNEQILIALKEL